MEILVYPNNGILHRLKLTNIKHHSLWINFTIKMWGEKRQIVEYIHYAAIYVKVESMWKLYVFYLGVQTCKKCMKIKGSDNSEAQVIVVT